MKHVLELFRNLKIKKIRHEFFFGFISLFMRKLQFQILSHIVCFTFLFWTLYKEGGVIIQFHIKFFVHMGCDNQKAQTKTKKQIMHNLKKLPSPTYVPTYLPKYLTIWVNI
jgi:hypothetical protein